MQLLNNTYQVDPLLTGRKIQLVYDPYDMTGPLAVFVDDKPAGVATLVLISRHAHPRAEKALRDEQPDRSTGPATGIDYLRLIEDTHKARITAAGINYTNLEQDPLP
ncbi:MAG: hypothetical protein FWF36_10165 [Propionibacteriaceae bacterium]|nr:hypothetical protein [Propionibacteriaceae bacterium]